MIQCVGDLNLRLLCVAAAAATSDPIGSERSSEWTVIITVDIYAGALDSHERSK
jgi:hypothetical protein